ncbi:MAG: PD-(D/E)XK nuclease family protein [Melioribacteraceae bacterium]
MQHNIFIKKSEELILSSEFKLLHKKLTFKESNIWQILGITRKERLLTKFLTWLLNPLANHTFRTVFLKFFLIEAIREANDNQCNFSPIEIDILDLSRAKVISEHTIKDRRYDIIIKCEESSFMCIIENKIDAKESKNQTNDYYKNSFDEFSIEKYKKRLYVFLSPLGELAQNDNFINITYDLVIKSIFDLESQHNCTNTEKFLLNQFRENLRGKIAMDKKTIDLAKSINDKYQDVINFIYENTDKPESTGIDRIWDGKSWFLNIGEKRNESYSWDDCRIHSFICAGGGKRYRTIMEKFEIGDKIYTYLSKFGYVGIGEVVKKAVPISDVILLDDKKLLDLNLKGKYDSTSNLDDCDWVAIVKWEIANDRENAVRYDPIVPSTSSKIYQHRKLDLKKLRMH